MIPFILFAKFISYRSNVGYFLKSLLLEIKEKNLSLNRNDNYDNNKYWLRSLKQAQLD